MTVGCVVLAAGKGERFGGNKLTASLGGRTLIRRALETLPASLENRVVVTRYEEVSAAAEEYGIPSVFNGHPERGLSWSVRLGTERWKDCDGILFLVADQPLLRRESVERLLEAFAEHPDRIVALSSRGRRGNPCLFPRVFFPELMALEGDRGGSQVIRRHPERVLLVEAAPEELTDVDTRDTLAGLESGTPQPLP